MNRIELGFVKSFPICSVALSDVVMFACERAHNWKNQSFYSILFCSFLF